MIHHVQKRLLQNMVHDRSQPGERSLIQSVSRRRTDQNYAFAAQCCFGAEVLDIGPGFGLGYGHLLAVNPKRIIAVDHHADSAEHFMHRDKRIQFRPGNFLENDLSDASFDTILCIAAVYYFSELSPLLAQINRLLRPGGQLIINNFDADVMRFYFRHTLRDLDEGYGPMYTAAEFETALYDALQPVEIERRVQSPVRLQMFSLLCMPLRLIFDRMALHPADLELKGVYNMYKVTK